MEPQQARDTLARASSAVQNLRSPTSGVLGQGVRFALTGGIVALVYLATTIVLASVVGIPFQVALAAGFCLGLTVHFALQRTFVWIHHEEFALPMGHQAGRYLTVAVAQYAVTAASTSLLPPALGVPAEIVYLVTVVVMVSANFVVFRHGIFHTKPAVTDSVSDSVVRNE
jgi:putative flippase GtrA